MLLHCERTRQLTTLSIVFCLPYFITSRVFFKAIDSPLLNRVMFHLSHKFNDETRLMAHHRQLNDVTEDQLTLASIHYLRSHYQEAIDIYKRILGEHP